MDFLSARPLHTFIMSSWIKDNGLVSSLNRGTFYGYRDESRELRGVALVGHVTLFETRVDAALKASLNSRAIARRSALFWAKPTKWQRCRISIATAADRPDVFAVNYYWKNISPRISIRSQPSDRQTRMTWT